MADSSSETAPFDARFPNTNQSRNCWQNFVDFYRCQKIKGDDYQPCDYFKRSFSSLCPADWWEQWSEKMEADAFAGKI